MNKEVFYYYGVSSSQSELKLISKINEKSDYKFFFNTISIESNTDIDVKYSVFVNRIQIQNNEQIFIISTKTITQNMFPKFNQLDYLIVSNYNQQVFINKIKELNEITYIFDIDFKNIKMYNTKIIKMFEL